MNEPISYNPLRMTVTINGVETRISELVTMPPKVLADIIAEARLDIQPLNWWDVLISSGMIGCAERGE